MNFPTTNVTSGASTCSEIRMPANNIADGEQHGSIGRWWRQYRIAQEGIACAGHSAGDALVRAQARREVQFDPAQHRAGRGAGKLRESQLVFQGEEGGQALKASGDI